MISQIKNWNQLASSTDAEILDWAEQQSWAIEMAACMQDPAWHAEGDVWTHTKMVADELAKLDDWDSLSRKTQIKLLVTGLLHDCGKPATTVLDETTGHIRSPKHAQVGSRMARRLLMEMECDFATREEIFNLVSYHGRPPYLSEKADPERELIKLSAFVDHRLLYRFALADWRGRISTQPKKGDDQTLKLWEMVAEESHCLSKPFEFSNDHARFLFYRGRLDNLHYTPHENYRCKMTVMCGLPGAGKNTWLNRNRPELPVVSLDELREELDVDPTDNQGVVVQTGKERCREFLRSGTDFALNATNTTQQTRKLWIDLGADYNARIEVVYIEPPLKTLFAQNKDRESRVPAKVIERLIGKLDVPTIAECHELLTPTFVMA